MSGAVPELLGARIAELEGKPEAAVRLLRPLAVAGVEPYPATVLTGLAWVRWALADAFDQVGQPDSAAAYLERNLLPPLWDAWERPYTHQRLAITYARQGRVADAERHLADAERAWDRPDPAIRRLLVEARTAVRDARSTTQPER
jgi:predicted Zn-dependent protease